MINRKAMAEAERADYEERARQFLAAQEPWPCPAAGSNSTLLMGLSFAAAAGLIILIGMLLVGA